MIYLQLFFVYFKIGLFGFGGGYAMLSLIQHEVVEVHKWVSQSTFADIVAISQVTPGPVGINSATYIGYEVTGSVFGSAIATFGVCLPSLLLMFFVSKLFNKYKDNHWVKNVFAYLRPAVIGLIATAGISLMNKSNFINYWSVVICIGAFISVYFLKLHPILMIVIAGCVGYVCF